MIIEDEHQLPDGIVSCLNREDYLCEQAFTCPVQRIVS